MFPNLHTGQRPQSPSHLETGALCFSTLGAPSAEIPEPLENHGTPKSDEMGIIFCRWYNMLKIFILLDQNHGHPEGDLSSEGFGSSGHICAIWWKWCWDRCVFPSVLVIPTLVAGPWLNLSRGRLRRARGILFGLTGLSPFCQPLGASLPNGSRWQRRHS